MKNADASREKLYFSIDAINGGFARLIWRDDESVTFDAPCAVLPSGAREGDYLCISIALDVELRAQESEKAKSLLKELAAKGDPNQTEFQL